MKEREPVARSKLALYPVQEGVISPLSRGAPSEGRRSVLVGRGFLSIPPQIELRQHLFREKSL